MGYLSALLSAFFAVIVLFLLAKLLGYRQVSDLSIFDYVNSISIGSIAAEMATSQGEDIIHCLIGLVVFALFTWVISILTDKSIKIRKFITGKPVILMQDGKMYDENFSKAKIDLNEFTSECRSQGYFDISKLDTVILEPNGRFSIMPMTKAKPATPSDLNLSVAQEEIPACVIIQGKIMPDALDALNMSEQTLRNKLAKAGYKTTDRIYFALMDKSGNVTAFPKCGQTDPDKLE